MKCLTSSDLTLFADRLGAEVVVRAPDWIDLVLPEVVHSYFWTIIVHSAQGDRGLWCFLS